MPGEAVPMSICENSRADAVVVIAAMKFVKNMVGRSGRANVER